MGRLKAGRLLNLRLWGRHSWLGCLSPPSLKWREKLLAQGGGDAEEGHGGHGHPCSYPHLQEGIVEQVAEDLLEDHVACEEEGEADRDHKEDVGPRLLGGGGHELGVVETEEEADGEEGQQAAVEDLSNQDDLDARSWKRRS